MTEALVTILPPKLKDPQQCKPGDLVRLLNSTPAGQVITAARLRKHRDRAGLRIGDQKTVDLFRYAAWLALEFEPSTPEPPPVPAETKPLEAETEPMANETIFRTRADAAKHFSVDERTIAKWLTMEDFPGKAGSRGKRDGYFPAEAIAAWRDGRLAAGKEVPGTEGKNFEQAGLVRAKRQLAELDLAERLGQLVDVEEVLSRMTRLAAEAAAMLRQLPAELVAQLGDGVDPETAGRIRERARKRVEQALRSIAKLAEAEADDAENEEEEEDAAGTKPTSDGSSEPRAKPKARAKPRKPDKNKRGRVKGTKGRGRGA